MLANSRAAVAAAVVLALTALPIALDGCSAFCEAHHDAVASTPSCHHASSATVRIGHPPAPCGHDHNGTTAMVSAGRTLVRTLELAVALTVAPAPLTRTISRQTIFAATPPGSAPDAHDRSLPLRI